jgi:hypothetical protein
MPDVAPYRPPCHGGRHYFSACCFNEWTPYEAGPWKLYDNITKIPHHETGELVAPYPVRKCQYLENPTDNDCENSNPFEWFTNVYNVHMPYTYQDFSHPRHFGYKVVYAKKSWHGRYGFNTRNTNPVTGTPMEMPQVKYLTISRSGFFSNTVIGDGPDCESTSDNYLRVTSVARYTGQVIVTACVEGDPPSTAAGGMSYEAGVWVGDPFLAGLLNDGGLGYSVTEVDTTSTHLHFKITHIDTNPDCDGGEGNVTQVWEGDIRLSDPYTARDVDDDAESLLATWNLCDDVQYPWRYDQPQQQGSPTCGVVFMPQVGPSYGPFVSFNESGPSSPDEGSGCPENAEPIRPNFIKGAPISYYTGAGEQDYAPWWNPLYESMIYLDPADVGICCWRTQTWGGPAPFRNATQWTPDWLNNAFPSGAIAFYNSPAMIASDHQPCCPTSLGGGGCGAIEQGALVKSKWGEVYLHEFPSHNYARPCGETDGNAVNQDYQDCDCNVPLVMGECPGGDFKRDPLVWPRDARWPNASTPTTTIPNSNKGSDVSCYCTHSQAENTGTDPHSCGPDATPSAVGKILAPVDDPPRNTFGKRDYGYSDTDKKGEASVKTWLYAPIKQYEAQAGNPSSTIGSLASMTCSPVCFIKSPCQPSALFIQKEKPSGKYADAGHVSPPSVALRGEAWPSYAGEIMYKMFHQAMVDPLYQRPKKPCDWDEECIEGICLNPFPVPPDPLEENRHCADGYCVGYVAHLDGGGAAIGPCEPGSLNVWTRLVPEIEPPWL